MGKIRGDNVVIFSARTLVVIWAVGFTSWRVLEANAAALFQQVPPYTLGTFVKLPDQAKMDEAVADIIGNVDYIRCAPYTQSFVWPDGVPRADEFLARVDDPTKRTKEEQAAYDLTCMGLAFILLHEMQHLILEKDRKNPANPREEEYACDRFALEYLMKHIDLTPADPRVLSKRAMGIVSAMFGLLALDIPAVWASPGPEHPSVIGRVQAVIRELDIPDHDLAWILLGSLLVGLLRHQEFYRICPHRLRKDCAIN